MIFKGMTLRRTLTFAVTALPLLFAAVGCKLAARLMHDDEVVARVGEHVLYRAELAAVIPDGVSIDDSAAFARQYINTWASGKVYLDVAEQQLSKGELDVSAELEEYRESLLKYRYEQHYINERLDTTISEREMDSYYEAHASEFTLSRPVVKARFISILPDSPEADRIRRLVKTQEQDESDLLDSLAYRSAIKYTDYGQNFVDVNVLAGDFGQDWQTLMRLRKGDVAEAADANGNISIAFIPEVVEAGKPAPLEYCKERITAAILSARKHEIVLALERDLLQKATAKGNFEIYE